MAIKNDIVQKLWGLCNILRDDGITFHQYVNELTYLLFLKMAREVGAEGELPVGYRWSDLAEREGVAQFDFYRQQLVKLGTEGSERVKSIFANPTSLLRHAENLNALIERIDSLDWFSARKEGLGDLYEGLLEKNASEKKSGAGQYFTPRPLIECMVNVMRPRAGEVIQDPAAGTGGFVIVADDYIKRRARKQSGARGGRFSAVELVQDTYRLLLMNVILHGIDGDFILGDSLSPTAAALPPADLILTNPPFGVKRGGIQPTRADLSFATSNKQLAFLQHVYQGLRPGGRAAVVVPDNVLFEEGIAKQIRADLMDSCDLHTILRLPTGIFYAQGVKTNVLFFTRGRKGTRANTSEIWFYDLRTNMPSFRKRAPLAREDFADFEDAFGDSPDGSSPRRDRGAKGRFRRFTRAKIAERGGNLDVIWLPETRHEGDEDSTPDELVSVALGHLQAAIDELSSLAELIDEEAVT
jgi:type I restriction enzyme M protein